MADVLIQATDLGKKYARSLRRSIQYGMRDIVSETMGRRESSQLREDEFWAVRDVNFELKRGECLAILGGNGAGKSTLLKVLSGILVADRGRVDKHGRMEKMIELASGMAPSLTGRENVNLRCRLLGLSGKQVPRKLEEVVAFAELEEFIDTPVQYYSSGMKARLGFALTVAMQPDILLIDEVLAVGDLGFRMKCYERVDEMRRQSAVILVTHGMNHVSRMASSGLVLHKGRVVHNGSVQGAIAKYQEFAGGRGPVKDSAHHPDRIAFDLKAAGSIVGAGGKVRYGDRLEVVGEHGFPGDLALSIVLHEGNGPTIADWHSLRSNFKVGPGERFTLELGNAELSPGFYQLVVVGLDHDGMQQFLSTPIRFKVEGLHLGTTRLQPLGRWSSEAVDPMQHQG